MSRTQKVALLLIWLGIVGGIAAVLFSWQVRREWVDPGGYMLVRRNLLTSEVDVWIGGEWVPLQRAGRSRGPLLAESRPSQADAPSRAGRDQPVLPARAPSPGIVEGPDQSPPRAIPARTHAPTPVKAVPPPSPEPLPEAAAPPAEGEALPVEEKGPPAEDEGPTVAGSIDPDIPIVRAPSPGELSAAEAKEVPSPPPDQLASAGENAPPAPSSGPA